MRKYLDVIHEGRFIEFSRNYLAAKLVISR